MPEDDFHEQVISGLTCAAECDPLIEGRRFMALLDNSTDVHDFDEWPGEGLIQVYNQFSRQYSAFEVQANDLGYRLRDVAPVVFPQIFV